MVKIGDLGIFSGVRPDETVDGPPAVAAPGVERRAPGVSVVIPTLNERDSLPNALNALTAQMRPSDEILVVDGGSDDGTIDVALSHGAEVIIAEGSSIGQARNIGSMESRNPVIASTDADAVPPGDWLSKIRSHFAADPDLVVLWGNVEDRNGVPVRNLVGKYSTLTGGASGNNTAFRKEAFEALPRQYPDVNFMEDVAIIARLSELGKTKRDKGLVMEMDMDRKRYQTVPILAASGAILGASTLVQTPWIARAAQGAALGLGGTELTYENETLTSTPVHHDQTGAVVAAGSVASGHPLAAAGAGVGAGMVAHHDLTEGISVLPSDRQKNTDEVIEASAPIGRFR